jgi:hypothetical protein
VELPFLHTLVAGSSLLAPPLAGALSRFWKFAVFGLLKTV